MVRFKEMERNSPFLGEARGIDLMIALEIVEDEKTGKPATNLTKRLRRLARQRGVMIELGSHHNNVARLFPPLVINEEHLVRAADILQGVLKELEWPFNLLGLRVSLLKPEATTMPVFHGYGRGGNPTSRSVRSRDIG